MDLNRGQQSAVLAEIEQPIRVVAGAGTGKTRVLVERYLRFVREGVPPARILALTFTLKAADEMRQRIFKAVGEENVGLLRELYAAWIMNFHSFGYRVIRENAPALGIDPGAEVATNAELRRIDQMLESRFLAGRIDGVPSDADFGGVMPSPTQLSTLFRMYLNVVKKCRGELIPIEEVSSACSPEDNESYVAHVGAIAAVYDAYSRALTQQNLIDFTDMISRATKALTENQWLGRVYREKFDHILVDEFQDTSTAQFELLRALSGDDFRRVTVVGDEKQSIYRWRDARVENIRDFPGLDKPLSENYRSRQNILDLAHAFMCLDPYYAGQSDKIKLTANRVEPNLPIVVYHPEAGEVPAQQNEAEAAALAAWIVHLTGGPPVPGVPELVGGRSGQAPLGYGDIAVLLRAVREAKVLPAIERTFYRAGIPYTIVGGSDASGSRALEHLASILWLLLPGDRRVELLHVLETPPFAVGHASLMEFVGADGESPGDARQLLSKDRVGRVADTDARERLKALRSTLERLRKSLASRDFRSFLLEAFEDTPIFHRMFEQGATVRAADDIVGELMDICDALDRRGNLGLWAFLEHLRAVLDDRSFGKDEELAVVPDRVRIMTIHQAKGLEFPAVAVPGIKRPRGDRDGFYLSRTRGLFAERWKEWNRGYANIEERADEKKMKLQEERCLLYVAVTRAKNFLFVASPYAGGVEKTGKSLFADFVEITEGGAFDTVNVRGSIDTPKAVARINGVDGTATAEAREAWERWRRAKDTLAAQEAVPDFPARPVHFVNWRALADYAACPLRYQFRYLHQIDDALVGENAEVDTLVGERVDAIESSRVPRGMTPAGYGTLVHELLCKLMADRSKEPTTEEDWIESTAIRIGVASRHRGVVVEHARRIVDAFLESGLEKLGDEIRLEEPFQVRSGLAVFQGVFDRVERIGDGWRVVDYKIGRGRAEYAFQVAFYAWALRAITGAADVTAQLCYISESGTALDTVDVDGIDIADHAKNVVASLTGKRFEATPGEVCFVCPYSAVCRYSGAA